MDKESMESNKVVDETTNPIAPTEKLNADDSELESDQSQSDQTKNVEELEAELLKAQEATKKAENTIVKLKKQGFKTEAEKAEEEKKTTELDMEAIKKEIAEQVKKELTPDLTKQTELERENRELKETLVSKQSISSGSAPSVKEPKDSKKQPSAKDVEMANRFFKGDVEKYMKYKTK